MKNLFATTIVVLVLFSCQKDDPALSSDKFISSFSFLAMDNPSLSSDVQAIITGEQISCIFPAGVSVTALKPTIVHPGSSISPASGVATDFTSMVNYTVTAKDKSTQKYTITVTVNQPILSSNKTITSFSFLKTDNPTLSENIEGTISGQTILCTVPAGISVTTLKPTVAHTGSSVNPASGTVNNFTTPATYTVSAEDGSSQVYTISVTVSEAGPSVYVVGGQAIFGTNYATVWKNGIATNLTNGTYNSSLKSVFVSGDIFYAAGNLMIGNSRASYWKIENGIELPTPGLNETINDAYANSIYVSGNNDVYVAGQENHGAGIGYIAKVWKNGTATSLTTKSGAANSVFVSGNDVYVAGWEETTTGWNAKVWKNGVATILSPDDIKSQGVAVFVSGSDVYVAGQYWNGSAYVIKVWINGVENIINPDTQGSEVSSIFVSNGDVYLAGREKKDDVSEAKVWKNGVGTVLSHVSNSEAKSVYVHHGDVYVAGWEPNNDGKLVSILWKNGDATPLATDAFACSVIVK